VREQLTSVKMSRMGFEVDGIHHLTLNVTDLEASRAFYTGVLGFVPDQDFPGEKLRYRIRTSPARSCGTGSARTRDWYSYRPFPVPPRATASASCASGSTTCRWA